MAATFVLVRERILAQLQKNMENLVDFDGNKVFEVVVRAPLVDAQLNAPTALGIVDLGDFNVEYDVGYITPTMRVAFEFSAILQQGDVAATRLNEILGHVTKYLLQNHFTKEDVTEDELSLDVKYASFEPNISDAFDTYVNGVATYDILYRHAGHDPFDLR